MDGLAYPYRGALGRKAYLLKQLAEKKLGTNIVPYLIYVVRVELRRAANLLRFPCRRDVDRALLQSCARDGPPSLLTCCVGWVSVCQLAGSAPVHGEWDIAQFGW
jgi:hypothetical protein